MADDAAAEVELEPGEETAAVKTRLKRVGELTKRDLRVWDEDRKVYFNLVDGTEPAKVNG